MKKFFQYSFFILLFCKEGNSLFAQRTYLTIKGYVTDKNTRVPISNATVTLSNGSQQSYTTGTNSFGNFTIDSVANTGTITVQVNQADYTPFSQTYSTQINKTAYDLATIELEPVIHTLSAANYILNNLISNQILPTEGAKELFYTLNPELRNIDSVQSNYKMKLPDFPKMDKSLEQDFNKEFKKNKNKSNPDVFLFKKELPGYYNNNLLTWNGSASSYSGDKNKQINFYGYYKDNPEKFVFVIWKKDKNGNAILTGPEVEKRFLVYYYGSYKEGDTSIYHKADDATYGYATMWNASYKIIIIDKLLHKEVKISDPVIETSTYFNRKDLFTMLNIHANWIKIPIQIFD